MTTYPTENLHPHPQADRVPWPEPDDYDALVADIEAHGIQVPIDALPDGTVLDGRTRLAIARKLALYEVPVRWVEPSDPLAYMIRMAVMRRHLSPATRKALAARLLQEAPERSDRSIAKTVGIDHKTVAAVRDESEGRGDIPHVEQRTDTLGRQQPATKPEREPQPPEPIDPPSPPVPFRERVQTEQAAMEAYLDADPRPVVLADPGATAALDERQLDAGETVLLGAVRQIDDDTAAYSARERALTPEMREAEAAAAASAEWHRAWSAVLRITGGLDPEAVLPRMTSDEHITVRAAVRSMRDWLDRVDRAMATDGLRAIKGGRS